MRTAACPPATRRGRLGKANEFLDAAETLAASSGESAGADAIVTLLVHAGIAASDAICCRRLGQHAQGDSHRDAVALLAKADPKLSKHLSTLLSLKTKSGYSHNHVTAAETKQARRAAQALVEAARLANSTGSA